MKVKYIYSENSETKYHLCFLKFIDTSLIHNDDKGYDYCIINNDYNYFSYDFVSILLKLYSDNIIILIDEEKYKHIKCNKGEYIYNKIKENYDIYNNIFYTPINKNDYFNGYLELMKDNFTNYNYTPDFNSFSNYIYVHHNVHIFVIKYDNKIIGAGTLFILRKIHNPPVAQLEDIVISSCYRKYGLGFILIEKLKRLANELGCYKVILNCSENNIDLKEMIFIKMVWK